MRHGVIFLVGMIILTIGIACGREPQPVEQLGDWSIIQSPLTGRCYEYLQHEVANRGFAGLALIPCDVPILISEGQ